MPTHLLTFSNKLFSLFVDNTDMCVFSKRHSRLISPKSTKGTETRD